MKYREFKKLLKKPVFTWEEAKVVAFNTPAKTLKLQLHHWKKTGEIISLKRGVYLFPDQQIDKTEIAKHLYSPCYLSLEYALNHYGLLPEIVFAMTLITTKSTRKFNTPFGQFTYQKIKQKAFLGFDPKTLMAEREKALVDYLYLNRHRFLPTDDFWSEMRWQNLKDVKFRKAAGFARHFQSNKLDKLLNSLRTYAKFN